MGKITAGAGSTKKGEIMRMRYRAARMTLLIATLFGALNTVFLFIESAVFYVPFSFVLPYGLMIDCLFWTGKLYTLAEYQTYFGMTSANFLHQDTVYLYAACVLAVVAVLVTCWVLSKKHAWAMIAGCVLMAVDSVSVLFFLGFSLSNLTEILMHVLMLVIMILGVVAHYRLKFMDWIDADRENVPAATASVESMASAVMQAEDAVCDSRVLHPVDYSAKCKILLACDVGEYAVCYRRLGTVNELAINKMVYDTANTGRVERPHELNARVDGHDIAVGLDECSDIYVRFDGEIVKKKPR